MSVVAAVNVRTVYIIAFRHQVSLYTLKSLAGWTLGVCLCVANGESKCAVFNKKKNLNASHTNDTKDPECGERGSVVENNKLMLAWP